MYVTKMTKIKKKISKIQVIKEIKKINGVKKLIIKDTDNLIKKNYLDSFGYVELATILEKKFKIKINQSKFFDYKNANLKSILIIINK